MAVLIPGYVVKNSCSEKFYSKNGLRSVTYVVLYRVFITQTERRFVYMDPNVSGIDHLALRKQENFSASRL